MQFQAVDCMCLIMLMMLTIFSKGTPYHCLNFTILCLKNISGSHGKYLVL